MEDFKIRNLKLQITNLKLIIYRTVRIQLRRKKKKDSFIYSNST